VLVLLISLAELAALAALVITATLAAMAILVAVSVLLTAVAVTNKHQILVVTRQGNVLLSASSTGWPTGVIGPTDRQLVLPEPKGLGVPVVVSGRARWIDRASYQSLAQARSALAAVEQGQ
jgi:hypothetical protein